MNNLPTYFIDFDEDDFESGINFIAITETPAIEKNSMRFTEQELLKLIFTDEDKMIIAGPAIIPDKKIYRRIEDQEFYVVFTKEVIEKMVSKFNSESREYKFNIEHNSEEVVAGYIKGSWIIEDPKFDKAGFYGFTDLPVGTWFIEAQITDKEIWNNHVKKMDSVGWSIEGLMATTKQDFKQNLNKNMENRKKEMITLSTQELQDLIKKEIEEAIKKDPKDPKDLKEIEDAIDKIEDAIEDEAKEALVEDESKESKDDEAKTEDEIKEALAEDEVIEDEVIEDEAKAEDEKISMDEVMQKIVDMQSAIEALEAKLNSLESEEIEQEFSKIPQSISDKIFKIQSLKN